MAEWQRWKNIMKCYPFEEKRLAKWSPPYIVQPKLDGDRCKNVPMEKTSLLLTSEENVFYSVPHIHQQLIDSKLCNLPLDGELYSHKLYKEGGHELIHGICSRTVNLHPRHKEMEFWVFDVQEPFQPQAERTIFLQSLPTTPNIKIVPYKVCETLEEIMRYYDDLIEQGFEGIIVRNLYALYEKKRSTWIMKFKPKQSDVYKIVGYEEEISKDGIPKGRLGALVCESGDGGTFNVGSGIKDDEREALWAIRGMLNGMSVRIKYQHITTGRRVPRFPVFAELVP